jgi:ERCC4-type nuclease
VGPKTAKALLDEYGDAASVFMAAVEMTPRDLTDVKGIGEKTANDIEAALTR